MTKLKMPPGRVLARDPGTVFTLMGEVVHKQKIAMAKRRIALHEASHAVCGRTLGIAGGGASIEPDSHGYDGHAVVAGHFTIHNDLIARGEYQDFQSSVCLKIMVCLAGSEAEKIAGFDDADLGGDDRVHVLDLCRRYYISDATVEDLKYRTRGLLTKNWSKVERVAAALLSRRTLTGAEINALIGA